MDTPFLLSPLALGSVVAKVVFPAGYVECDATAGDRSPALFRLLRFLLEVLVFERGRLVSFIQRRRSFPECENAPFGPSKITRKKSTTDYSPTTGTCQLSPFASPTRSKEQEHKNGPSNGKRKTLNHLSLTKRKKSITKDDELMVLLAKVEKSAEEIVKIMRGLSSIQALEGNRKLENLIGISCGSCFLKREMQKTKELMTKVTKQKLFEKKSSELSNKELHHLDSYEFLKAILN
ncbi:centromere protein R isoform X2 [Phyllostomus discolor]|uniref:Centromere protein R isoform X2 n=1 Tax=Phyllostomus discolor TaxID=89673 RepID=A0A7E6DT50_9CHIR|nr:centromere protein R isoform X2 [Phyllostomus discolor]